jgi:hypothetical protein
VLVSATLSLVDDVTVAVSFDVMNKEVEVAVGVSAIAAVDDLVIVVSINMLVEVSESVNSLLSSAETLWLVLVVEKLVGEAPLDELAWIGSVILEEAASLIDEELENGSCASPEVPLAE